MRLWIRTLADAPARTLLSAVALAGAVALVLVFEGFRGGLFHQVRAFPERFEAPLVAAQSGVENMTGARSVLPRSARQEVEAVPGVRTAHPLGGIPIVFEAGGRATPVYVVAFDTAGGPRALRAGRAIERTGEIVVDAALAAKYGLAPGDEIRFLGYGFRVAGISGEPSSMLNPYVYVRLVDLVDLYLAGELPRDLPMEAAVGFLLIELEPGAAAAAVRRRIEAAVPALDVHTPSELADHDAAMADRLMGPILDLLVFVAYAAGVLVAMLILYASVVARRREFGVMKAIGADTRRLGLLVLREALALSVLAFGLGIGLAALLALAIESLAPQYLVEPLAPGVLLRTAFALAAMAALGALAPIRSLAALEPDAVFR